MNLANVPQGLAIWIWELPACERGDPGAIAAKAKASGVSTVFVKAGSTTDNGQVTAALVARLRTDGIDCVPWWYCVPSGLDAQIALLKSLQERAGATGFAMDAEVEWDKPDQREIAAQFAQRIRDALGKDAWLADAPWARPVSHKAPFPYREFGRVMNCRMPQFYWELAEVAGEPQAHFFDAADAEWEETAPGIVVCPALSTVNEDGTKHAPIGELAAALDRYAARPLVSLWSWQHLTAAEWALLEERAAISPPPAANPLAGIPVPGLVIPGENA